MRRFFKSPYPTFGSYSNPITWRVESSPYYWWWYALTLNHQYLKCCSANGKGRLIDIYRDFGDVRYEGNRYLAFAKWWTAKLNKIETKGSYLFAEPLLDESVHIVETEDDAIRAVSSVSTLLIAIPVQRQKGYVERTISNILKNELENVKGREIRNPLNSQARYHLTKASTPNRLKTQFDLLDAFNTHVANGKAPKLYTLIDEVGVTIKSRVSDEISTKEEKRRVASAIVSRHLKNTRQSINNAALGVFP